MTLTNVPAYETYTLRDLEEALLLIDRAVYPERVKIIEAEIAARRKALHPRDYSLRDLQALRAAQKAASLPPDSPEQAFAEAVSAEIKRRETNPDWRQEALPAYRKLSLSKTALYGAAALAVLLIGFIVVQSGKIQPDHPFVKDALYVAGQTASVKKFLGDSLTVVPPVTGKLTTGESAGLSWAAISVKGDSGTGVISVEGVLKKGQWNYTMLKFAITPGDSVIELMPELRSLAERDSALAPQEQSGSRNRGGGAR